MDSRSHGVSDPGANVLYDSRPDLTEDDYALGFTKRIHKDLLAVFAAVGEGKAYLRDRGYFATADDYAANKNSNLFIEWHTNSGGGTGVEVLYRTERSEKLAKMMAAAGSKALGLKNRGAKFRNDLAVLHEHPGMDSVLGERWFGDTSKDVHAYLANKPSEELAYLNCVLTWIGWPTVMHLPRTWNAGQSANYKMRWEAAK